MALSRLCAVALVFTTAAAQAANIVEPDPALSPTAVVETQLDALQVNDTPQIDAGIAQAWAFAHPDNKRITGPLPRFARMIKGPLYRFLLDHGSHEVKEVSKTKDTAILIVTVTSKIDEVIVYQWQLAKVAEGENAGTWMTTRVSAPVYGGQAI